MPVIKMTMMTPLPLCPFPSFSGNPQEGRNPANKSPREGYKAWVARLVRPTNADSG
jgi:hypothetical protein